MRFLFSLSLIVVFTISSCKNKTNEQNGKPSITQSGKSLKSSKKTLKNFPENNAKTPRTVVPSGEGQWPWADLGKMDSEELKRRGFKIDLKDFWLNGKGLAKSVVGLPGCSGSFISADGLILTNHHCAYGIIQKNSTSVSNLLENGFTAQSRKDELDGKGMNIWVFGKQVDITKKIVNGLEKFEDDYKIGKEIEKRVSAEIIECEKDGTSRCQISRENKGLRYILLRNFLIRDVRLVAAPPRSIGEFGGEVDNWRWPRHTLDFTILRAYVAPDGKSAAYNKSNIPFKPESYLKININGLNEGDPIMVVGTPYRTNRYALSYEVEHALSVYYPVRERIFDSWIKTIEIAAVKPGSRIAYSTWVKRLNNGLTNARGMIAGLKRNKVLENKNEIESKWKKWVKKSKNEQWIESFENLKKGNKKYSEDEKSLLINYTVTGVTPFNVAVISLMWQRMSQLPDAERLPGFQERDKNIILSRLKNSVATYDPDVETAIFLNFCSINPLAHTLFEKSLKMDRKILQGQFINTSILKNKNISDILTADFIKKNQSDPIFKYAKDLENHYFKYLQNQTALKGFNQKFRVPYLQSLVKFLGKKYYPDANASPRVSFAHVAGYIPQEGVLHTPWTTISGLISKETGRWPFSIPASLRAVHSDTVKMTPFRDKNLLDIPACFLSNADTTGGNSGSPVLNASGELVGINFDRVYENIAGDFGYNPSYSRNISTDIRAILWYLKEIQKWPGVNALLSVK